MYNSKKWLITHIVSRRNTLIILCLNKYYKTIIFISKHYFSNILNKSLYFFVITHIIHIVAKKYINTRIIISISQKDLILSIFITWLIAIKNIPFRIKKHFHNTSISSLNISSVLFFFPKIISINYIIYNHHTIKQTKRKGLKTYFLLLSLIIYGIF